MFSFQTFLHNTVSRDDALSDSATTQSLSDLVFTACNYFASFIEVAPSLTAAVLLLKLLQKLVEFCDDNDKKQTLKWNNGQHAASILMKDWNVKKDEDDALM